MTAARRAFPNLAGPRPSSAREPWALPLVDRRRALFQAASFRLGSMSLMQQSKGGGTSGTGGTGGSGSGGAGGGKGGVGSGSGSPGGGGRVGTGGAGTGGTGGARGG